MHLSSEAILDLIENTAADAEAAAAIAHLAVCAECSRRFEEWSDLHRLLKRRHLDDAPDDAIREAEAIFRPPLQDRAAKPTVIARIIFDSFAQPAFIGTRGPIGPQQLVLRAAEFDVHVKIWGGSGEKRLAGQILARDTSTFTQSARLHLLSEGVAIESVSADALGEFSFSGVPEGPLSLQIDLPHLTIVSALDAEESG